MHLIKCHKITNTISHQLHPQRSYPGEDPRFQVRGAHFKKLCRAEGGAKIVGVFRVKNHDFAFHYKSNNLENQYNATYTDRLKQFLLIICSTGCFSGRCGRDRIS
jgi:hypothetical protein